MAYRVSLLCGPDQYVTLSITVPRKKMPSTKKEKRKKENHMYIKQSSMILLTLSCITDLRFVNREIHDLSRPKTTYICERVVNRTIFLNVYYFSKTCISENTQAERMYNGNPLYLNITRVFLWHRHCLIEKEKG